MALVANTSSTTFDPRSMDLPSIGALLLLLPCLPWLSSQADVAQRPQSRQLRLV